MFSTIPPQGMQTGQYDPMMTNFMTGGQMGYMPNAQFLTSPEYGAFRTMPPTQMAGPILHRPSMWESYMTAKRGTVFGVPYMYNTYNPVVSQMQHLAMAQRRISDSMSAIGGTALDAAGSMGVAALVGGTIGGPIGLMAGLVAGSIMPDIASPYLDRLRSGRGIQSLTASKISSADL